MSALPVGEVIEFKQTVISPQALSRKRVHLCRYMTYGEQEWREATEACLKHMELYDDNSEQLLPLLLSLFLHAAG